MKTRNIFKVMIATSMLMLGACGELLEEKNPSGITDESVYTTPEGFETLVNASYATARHWYGKEDGYTLAEGGTDLWLQGVDNRRVDLMTYNNLQATENMPPLSINEIFLERIWERFYATINLINAGILRIDDAGLAEDLKLKRKAELHFLRAFYYWHIVETWGGVHLTTEETSTVQTTANRSSVDDFYALIFSDLAFAVENLPPTTTDYGRVTKPAAEAFLARMHLTRGNNAEALALSQKVISDYGFQLVPKYADLWSMQNLKNKEVVWAVNYTVDLTSSDLLNTATNPFGHPRGGHNAHMMFLMTYERVAAGAIGMQRDVANGRPFARYMPTKFLLDLFDETIDARYNGSFQTVWKTNKAGAYKKTVNGVEYNVNLALGDTAIFASKYEIADEVDATKKYLIVDQSKMYKNDGNFNGNQLYIPLSKFLDPTRPTLTEVQSARDAFVIRLAEMYLIAAEAKLNLNDAEGAAEFINAIRTRAAVPGKVAEMQVEADDMSIDFILDERARELAGEQLRWFDLKRTGKLVERVVAHNPAAAPYVKEYHNVRPIPQRQLDAVTNKAEFTQNDGYQ
ncbi:RagB/SusD family nutrient uptake outer membrane protein [Pseudochryseolinea flava]|uniref:RagB/SusD family nutrient uptake outer membrane protein n=1 Tax=Pseudochryseolinea flava TaxID=2059302 RepID=A0A364Y0M3_9BACT|nr:RagB/SusD family nutrient uptake outer membrane protein [Pseudochryseolinea flava]RAW00205.1 RagB/SusD family nutrient uptake outer membrane protein [Pseudochryseolinea flava]